MQIVTCCTACVCRHIIEFCSRFSFDPFLCVWLCIAIKNSASFFYGMWIEDRSISEKRNGKFMLLHKFDQQVASLFVFLLIVIASRICAMSVYRMPAKKKQQQQKFLLNVSTWKWKKKKTSTKSANCCAVTISLSPFDSCDAVIVYRIVCITHECPCIM